MKAEQVDQALHQKFITEGKRLVFWHDLNSEFDGYVDGGLTGDLSGVNVLDVAKTGGLSAKLLLEREDPTGQYLVYTHGEAPPADEDWLLDIRLYSAEFYAEVESLWLQELGLSRLSLRDHLKKRALFLRSQERRRKLVRFVSANDDEAALDLKMMAVLAKSPVASVFEVLRAICHGHTKGEGAPFELAKAPAVMADLNKMGLADRFWGLMGDEFGYAADSPSVAGLLRRLFVSELLSQVDGDPPSSLAHHMLPDAGRRNAVVFLTQWRDSSGNARSYDAASAAVATEQRVKEPLTSYGLETLSGVFTFWDAEMCVASALKEQLLSKDLDAARVREIVSARKAGHWLSGPGSEGRKRRAVSEAYDAIVAAAELLELQAEHRQSLQFDNADAVLTAYQDELFRLDQLYRHFCVHAQPAMGLGWDLLKTLAVEVERVYDNGFLYPLGVEWSRLLDGGFLKRWRAEGMTAQQDFYKMNIGPHLAGSDRRRAFVIVSDAFRYEAAEELTALLNGRYRMNADLSAMLGVLPSYTKLGMASLLPHRKLSFKKDAVLADDQSTAGLGHRNKILESVNGMACQATELREMKLEEAREFTEGKRVVYIYHNVIDRRSEGAATEHDTFHAVSQCLEELAATVQFCVNRLNAAKVWITADHGFLYQNTRLDETDRSKTTEYPPGVVSKKQRYVIGYDLGEAPEAHHGSIDVTAGAAGGTEFWVPRGTNRFYFRGGARFTHGGAMPQEVVVPLVTVTQLRGKRKEGSRVEKVSVQVLGTNHKITTPKYRFEILQTEAVSERRKPITLRAVVLEGAEPVTSVETVTVDSTSGDMNERQKSILLELRTGTFDKSTAYRLVLRDVETDAEVQSVPVVIDRSFDDDF